MGAGVTDPEVNPTPGAGLAAPARSGGRPILFVVIAAVVAAVVVQQDASSSSTLEPRRVGGRGARRRRACRRPTSCRARGTARTGTSQPDGRADETVIVASLARTGIDVTITVMPGGDAGADVEQLRLAPGEEARVPVADILATPEPGVVVEAVGGRAVVSHELDRRRRPRGRAVHAHRRHRLVLRVGHHGRRRRAQTSRCSTRSATTPSSTSRSSPTPACRSPTGSRPSSCRAARASPSRCRTASCASSGSPRTCTRVSGASSPSSSQIFDGTVPDGGPTRQGIALSLGVRAPATTWWHRPRARRTDGGIGHAGARQLLRRRRAGRGAGRDGRTARRCSRETVRVPSQRRRHHRRDHAGPDSTPTTRSSRPRSTPTVDACRSSPSCWRRGRRRRRRTGVAGTLGHPVTRHAAGSCPQPDVDADASVTVFNPGPDPVTAELLAGRSRRSASRRHQRARARDPARQGQERPAGARSAPPGAAGRHRQPPDRGRPHAAGRRRRVDQHRDPRSFVPRGDGRWRPGS